MTAVQPGPGAESGRVLSSALARIVRRGVGLALVGAGVWVQFGPGWSAIVVGLLVIEPWRAS